MKYIDLEKGLKKSDSALLRRLPRPAINFLRWVIKEDELNEILERYAGYDGVDFLQKMVEEFNLELDIRGEERLPESGRAFFVANHPFGIADGLVLTYIVSKRYGDLRAIGNEAFLLVPNLKSLIAAVNVFGRSSREYLEELDRVMNSDIPITHFPAGVVSRYYEGKVSDGKWEKSFIKRANVCKRDVVPIKFCGKNSSLFYAIFRIRRALKIDVNIELALLPRELLNKRGKRISVVIGETIPYSTFDESRSTSSWAEFVKNKLYSLN